MSIQTSNDSHLGDCPRHARRRPHGEPLPGSIWALVAMVAWALAVATTILSVVIFGGSRNGLWLLAAILYVIGVAALVRAWGWER